MTATLAARPSRPPATSARTSTASARPVLRTGVVAALVASAATTATAVVAHAAGVTFDISGKPIPLAGFAQVTFVATMIGTLLAVVCSRRATRPRHTFVVTTLVLTALSILPDTLADAQVSTRLTLALTHVVAAAIVIPVLLSQLSD